MTMARVTLICPPYLYNHDIRQQGRPIIGAARLPSIGLAYVASALRAAGHAVDLIDAVGEGIEEAHAFESPDGRVATTFGLSHAEIVRRIAADTQLIGLTCMFSNEWRLYKTLLRAIRERFPSTVIMLGGEHATADWEFVLSSDSGVDACILGEGEETAAELASFIGEGRDWSQVAGIAHARGGKAVRNERRKRMASVAGLLPAWDLFPINEYLRHGTGMNCAAGANFPILASRGCPYSCTFCSSPQMWGHSYVARDPDEIVGEMLHWKSIYPAIEHFIFVDLAMTIKKDWTVKLARAMAEKKIGATWHFGPGTRTEVMSHEVIDALKASGLTRIDFASETGSKNTIAKINKRINLKKMCESMRYAASQGMLCKTTLIYGFPGQTISDCIANVLFAARVAWAGVDEVQIFEFNPYPGTVMHEDLITQKRIPDKQAEPERYEQFLDLFSPVGRGAKSWSEHLPSRLFSPFFWATHLLFMAVLFTRHPGKLLRLFRRAWTETPETRLEQRVTQLFGGDPERRKLIRHASAGPSLPRQPASAGRR
jgi:radical SAM superfamily enzyme YgiQ (UPF0313 family)